MTIVKNKFNLKLGGACLIAILILISINACTPEEQVTQKQYNFISPKEEVSVGVEAGKLITEKYGVYKNPNLNTYVNEITTQLQNVTEEDELTYKTILLDSSTINSFSLIGGTIFITRGYLAELNSEAELAFVLGRQVAHLVKNHGEKRLSNNNIDSSVLAAGLMAGKQRLRKEWEVMVQDLVEGVYKGYSKDSELIADKRAIEYITELGYNPLDGIKSLSLFSRDYLKSKTKNITQILPDTKQRQQLIEAQLIAAKDTQKDNQESSLTNKNSRSANRTKYLEQIEAVVIGGKKQAGRILKNWYVNDHHQFTFDPVLDWVYFFKLEKGLLRMNYRDITIGKISVVFNSQDKNLFDLTESELKEQLDNQNITLKTPLELKEKDIKSGGTYISYSYPKEYNKIIGFFLKRKDQDAIKIEFDVSGYEDYIYPRVVSLVKSFEWIPTENLKDTYHLKLHELEKTDTLDSLAKKYLGSEEKAGKIALFNNIQSNVGLQKIIKIKIPR